MLVAGLVLTLAGMVWLSRAGQGAEYLTGNALPMVPIGTGQGLAIAPITSFGVRRLRPAEAGAASGVLNTMHHLGSCIGLATLTSAAAGAASTIGGVHIALTGSSVLLVIGLIDAAFFIAPTAVGRRR